MFCIELVNITLKQRTLGWNKMYLQLLDNVAWISWKKDKVFCANCSPPRLISECEIREGYIIAAMARYMVFNEHCLTKILSAQYLIAYVTIWCKSISGCHFCTSVYLEKVIAEHVNKSICFIYSIWVINTNIYV